MISPRPDLFHLVLVLTYAAIQNSNDVTACCYSCHQCCMPNSVLCKEHCLLPGPAVHLRIEYGILFLIVFYTAIFYLEIEETCLNQLIFRWHRVCRPAGACESDRSKSDDSLGASWRCLKPLYKQFRLGASAFQLEV